MHYKPKSKTYYLILAMSYPVFPNNNMSDKFSLPTSLIEVQISFKQKKKYNYLIISKFYMKNQIKIINEEDKAF